MEHRMRKDVFSDARAHLPESTVRFTCIGCGAAFISGPYTEGGGLAAEADLMKLWGAHVEEGDADVQV